MPAPESTIPPPNSVIHRSIAGVILAIHLSHRRFRVSHGPSKPIEMQCQCVMDRDIPTRTRAPTSSEAGSVDGG